MSLDLNSCVPLAERLVGLQVIILLLGITRKYLKYFINYNDFDNTLNANLKRNNVNTWNPTLNDKLLLFCSTTTSTTNRNWSFISKVLWHNNLCIGGIMSINRKSKLTIVVEDLTYSLNGNISLPKPKPRHENIKAKTEWIVFLGKCRSFRCFIYI